MSAITDILEYIAAESAAALTAQEISLRVQFGPLPADESVSLAYASGGVDTTYQDKGISYELSVVCNSKSQDQRLALEALATIHRALTQTKTYAETDAWQICDVATESTPNYIGREERDQFLYGSSLRVRAYIKI
ncbi:MAG: hypothetical protein IKD61_00500 [Oscillospiraceae bacterium]|nr:hypothetical protein [Oscillospiraceae bacterium]